MRNIKNLVLFWSVFLTPIVFVISSIVTFVFSDRPIHITCSRVDKVCSAYSLKLSTMAYHGMQAAKLEQSNPAASKKHAEKIQKHFTVPSKTFLVSDIDRYTCRKFHFDAMSKYKSYIVLKNGEKVILGQHTTKERCQMACQKVEQDVKNWNYFKDITLITE